MSKLYDNWKEMIDLIPKMQVAVDRGMETHHKDHSDHQHLKNELEELRPGIEILQGKFTLDIIFILNGKSSLYFNDIKASLPYINSSTLTKRLKELESNGIIRREVHKGQPVRVSYEITKLGKGIFQLLLPTLIYIRFFNDLE